MAREVSLFDVDDATGFSSVADMTVSRVPPKDVNEFCRRWHYTSHGGATSWSYGLWDGVVLVGVCSYNMPTMDACSCVFGADEWRRVLHMGRLVCADEAPRNSESRLIAGSLRHLSIDLPDIRAVLTYAAQSQGHVGYVYQATNAIYTGTGGHSVIYLDDRGRQRSDYQRGMVLNGVRLKGQISAAQAIQLGWTRSAGPPKHRYVYLVGNRAERRYWRSRLLLPVLPYPKEVQS